MVNPPSSYEFPKTCVIAYIDVLNLSHSSDVALAVDLIADAYTDKYDNAVLLSADSDFIPAVLHILSKHAKKTNLNPSVAHPQRQRDAAII